MLVGKGGLGEHVVLRIVEQCRQALVARAEPFGDAAPLLAGAGGIRLGEDRADGVAATWSSDSRVPRSRQQRVRFAQRASIRPLIGFEEYWNENER